MTADKCTLISPFYSKEGRDVFLSTTWCRDRLFNSNDPRDVLEFYGTFSNREEIIEWMKERPKGRAEIIEVEGSKDVIVVIPTADFYGKYAQECRSNIFRGLHIIFVESGHPRDPYFNYAHNCNVGLKKALEYNPKWIVLSNDDMQKIDDIEVLVNELSKIDYRKIKVVYLAPLQWHSYKVILGLKVPVLTNIAIHAYDLLHNNKLRPVRKIQSRFREDIVNASYSTTLALLLRDKHLYTLTGDIAVFSGNFVSGENGALFDETFINCNEDQDLSLRFFNDPSASTHINFKIRGVVGASLGTGVIRELRRIVGDLYLQEKAKSKGILTRKV